MRIMVLWSGGVESTSLLKYLLSTTTDEIVAHNITIHNPEAVRIPYEQKAMWDLKPMLTDIRPFEYTTSEINICTGKAYPHDIEFHYPIGILAMYCESCRQLMRAQCLEDSYQKETRNGIRKYVKLDEIDTGYNQRRQILRPFLKGNDSIETIAPWHETYTWTKAKHIEYLGDMFQYTWSCRKPVNGKECNKCHACCERNAAINHTSVVII